MDHSVILDVVNHSSRFSFFCGFESKSFMPNIDSLCISNWTGAVRMALSLVPVLAVWAWTALRSANSGLSYRLSSSLSELPAYNPPALSNSLWSYIKSWFVGWAWPKATFSLISLSSFFICFFFSNPTFFILSSLSISLMRWYLNSSLSWSSSSSSESSFSWILLNSYLASKAAFLNSSSFLRYCL